MAYTQNIPQASDDPSDSQPLLLANNQAIFTVNSVNHVDYDLADQGKHKFMQMPEQGSDPGTAVNEGALYTKESNSLSELFWQPENNGTAIQLTSGSITKTTSGITFLPGGMTMIWGQTTGTTGSKIFHTAFSTALLVLQVSTIATGAEYGSQKNQSITGFDWTANGTISAIQYLAIGY